MRYIKSGDIRQETVNCRLTGIPDCRQLGNRQEAGKFCQNAFPSTWNFLNSFQFQKLHDVYNRFKLYSYTGQF